MPTFSFQWPRLLRFHRSHSLSNDKSPPIIYDGVADTHHSGLSAPCSHPCSPAAGKPIDSQSSAGHSLIDRASQDFSSQTSQTSPVTPISSSSVFDSAQQLSPESPVNRRPTHLPCLPDHISSIERTQSLAPLHSPCSLPTSSFQSLDGLHLTVSFARGIQTWAQN
jgi:hypothetical protein